MTRVYFDGGITKNPGGRATYGYWIEVNGQEVAQGSGVAMVGAGATNNVAEYTGLVQGLTAALEYPDPLEVIGDSKIVVNALKRNRRPKTPHLWLLFDLAKGLVKHREVTWTWVDREQNERADRLAGSAQGWPLFTYEDLYQQPML